MLKHELKFFQHLKRRKAEKKSVNHLRSWMKNDKINPKKVNRRKIIKKISEVNKTRNIR